MQPEPKQIRVNFADVVAGRAYLRIPFAGKLLLCHWAGAPWSDKDSKACLSALQAEVIARREREKIVHGGSGLGKSVLGGCDLMVANLLPFRKVAVVAARYDHVAHEFQYLYRGLKTLFADHGQTMKRLTFRNQMNYHEYDAESIWGTRTIGISTQSDEGAQLLGREFTDVVCGEASHIPVSIFNGRLLRALDRSTMAREHGLEQETGTLSLYTTPDGYEGASAYEWERVKKATKAQPHLVHYGRVPWARTVWVREAAVTENPGYSRATFEARRLEASGDANRRRAFEEQYLGRMTYASGRIYRSFDEDRHVRPMPPANYIRHMNLGVGIDTGACTGILLAGIGRDGKKWILGESYLEKPQGGIYTNLTDAEEMLVRVLQPVFGVEDAGQIIRDLLFMVSIDPASQHKLEIIDRWDCALSSPNTSDQRSLLQTIDRVEKWFHDDDIAIVDSCDNLIEQIRKYVWKIIKSPTHSAAPVVREPAKGFDHLCDALRFILIPMADHGIPTAPPPAVTFAQQWEARQREALFGPLRRALERGAQREEWLNR